MEYQQKNPLKYYALPFLFEFLVMYTKVSRNKFIHNICIILNKFFGLK